MRGKDEVGSLACHFERVDERTRAHSNDADVELVFNMSQVEAAASLFGSSESGSDFFSVSEGEASAENSAAGTSNDEDFYSNSSQAASGLFDPVEVGGIGEQPLFDAPGETAQAGGSHVYSFAGESTHGQQYDGENHAQSASFTAETYTAHDQAAGHAYDQGTWQTEGLSQQASSDGE